MVEEMHLNETQGSAQEMRSLIIEIARALVDKPDQVKIETENENGVTIFRLSVAPEDVGKIIGKQGRTARSLRTILSAASMKTRQRFSLDITEDQSTET